MLARTQPTPVAVVPVITPAAGIRLEPDAQGAELPAELRAAFERGAGPGLLHLGAELPDERLPPALAWLRDIGKAFMARLCAVPELGELRARVQIPAVDEEVQALAAAEPLLRGGEYADVPAWWRAMEQAFRDEIAAHEGPVQGWLAARHAAWNLVGKVCFHLAENRGDDENPFAFLATYTARVEGGKPRHLPLQRALEGSSAKKDRAALLSLLVPVERAARGSPLVAELLESGDLYHPLAWTPAQARRFLGEVPELERAGITVRVPDWWRSRRPPRAEVTVRVGDAAPARGLLDAAALVDFDVGVTIDGETLSPAELRALLARADEGLVPLRGRWVEVDAERLRQVLAHWKKVQAQAGDGLSFLEAMRLLAGARVGDEPGAVARAAPERVTAGPWLAERLAALRAPETTPASAPPPGLTATLRPYQGVGVAWLRLATELGLGVLLADDMGLGKTIQVLGLLLHAKRRPRGKEPHLLVVPATLLGNWQAEAARFAPSLRLRVVHASAGEVSSDVDGADVVLTTYGMVARQPWLAERGWDILVLDEAQAIKNPSARQSRSVKGLRARARVALTGTPVENRAGDLWSLFDFLDPGLLGSAREFSAFAKRLAEDSQGYAPLRRLLAPYVLRRLKTDRSIVADLPDKTELKAYCPLAPAQAALYQRAVDELRAELAGLKQGIERRGRVLAFLMRFKQICNHPAHWLGHGSWAVEESGKLARLIELADVIAEKQEKVLVFTQFREATEPLSQVLAAVFGRPGLVLHGGTPVARRRDLVARFQESEDVPFMVLSLKAGGTGLNLTAASHVVHFDRWWNPAVEDQATDRAYRIGQHRNVLVHKLVCRGTVEERIDALLEAKQGLARELFQGGAEAMLTEMSDDELLAAVALDLRKASDAA